MSELQTIQLGCAGLVSDPGPFSGTPGGSLVEATNVSYRRPGVIEPRVPFWLTIDPTLTTNAECYGVATYFNGIGTSNYWMGYDSGAKWRNSAVTSVTGGFSFSRDTTHFAQSNGRGFFTANEGVAVIDKDNTGAARLAGSPRGPGFQLTLGTDATPAYNWLAGTATTGNAVGYRTCVVRTLADGTPLYGEPSELRTIGNTYNAGRFVTVTAYLTADMQAGDRVQIYRTGQVTFTLAAALPVPVIDEGRLLTEHVLTSADISAGYFSYDDKRNDASFSGPYLYTNASQEGSLLPNSRPYYARDVALYNGMMFYAGQRTPQRVSLTLRSTDWRSAIFEPQSGLVGAGSGAVTVTAGSNTVTGIPNPQQYAVGQYVVGGTSVLPQNPEVNGTFPALTKVTAVNVGAGTITVSANALANGTIAYGLDWIEVDDGASIRRLLFLAGFGYNSTDILAVTPKYVCGYDEWSNYSATGVKPSGGAADIERAWGQNYGATTIRVSAIGSETDSSDIALQFERTYANATSFVVRSSKPNAFNVVVDAVTGVTSAQEGSPGLLAWSKLDQPEAVPFAFTNTLGDPMRPIYRIVPTRDSVYVLKEDGCWRVFGDDPESPVFQPLDMTCRISANMANAVTSYGGDVYAWTTRGIVKIGAYGVQNIDGAIYQTANGPLGPSTSADRSFAISSPQGRWVAFGYHATATGAQNDTVWVYHPEVGAWATWTFRHTMMAGTSDGVNTIAGFANGYAVPYDYDYVETATAPQNGDLLQGFVDGGAVIASIVGNAITINAGSAWTPAVGDTIGGQLVTAVSSTTQFTVVNGAALSAGPADVRENNTCKVTWLANPGQSPATEKHWVHSNILFSRIRGGSSYLLKWQGFRNQTQRTATHTYDATYTAFSSVRPYQRRSDVPSHLGRDWALKIGFEWSQASCWFTCDGAAVSFNQTGDRV